MNIHEDVSVRDDHMICVGPGLRSTVSLLVLIAIVFFVVPTVNAQNVIPVVTANNIPDVVEVDVEGAVGENTTETYPGYVECDTGSQSQVTVNLQVTTGGWNCSIEPSSMTFVAGGETRQNYTVTVHVPNNSTADDDETSKVGGSWTGSGALMGDVDQDSTLIRIKRHYSFEMDLEHPEMKEAEMMTEVSVTVTNTGNGNDRFLVEFHVYESPGSSGWLLADPTSVEVEDGETGSESFNFTVTKYSGTYEFNLTVSSVGSLEDTEVGNVTMSEDFTIVVVGGEDPPTGGDDDDIPFMGPAEIFAMMAVVTIMFSKRRRLT